MFKQSIRLELTSHHRQRALEQWEATVLYFTAAEEEEESIPSLVALLQKATTLEASTTTIPEPSTIKPTTRKIVGKYKPTKSKLSEEANPYSHPVPLDSIVDENDEVIGDPGWLLDFGILGYGKCGTSTMMIWLLEHPEVQAFGKEMSELMKDLPGQFIRKLYTNLEAGPYQRGYKAPQDITQRHIMETYIEYWPHAKLILGIRHPVWWFESLYNFRVQNLPGHKVLPHPNDLVGLCYPQRFGACTSKGDFAASMMNMGKQHYPEPREATELEEEILSRYRRSNFNFTDVPTMPNPVFLFELTQLGDVNDTRNELFRRDFSNFMGLKELLPALPHAIPGKNRSVSEQLRRDARKIKICQAEFAPLREALMELSISNSLWIRQVFLVNPTVFVSSPEHFESIMEGWMKDPCEDEDEISSLQ